MSSLIEKKYFLCCNVVYVAKAGVFVQKVLLDQTVLSQMLRSKTLKCVSPVVLSRMLKSKTLKCVSPVFAMKLWVVSPSQQLTR